MLNKIKDLITNKNDSSFLIYIYLFFLGGITVLSFAPYNFWAVIFISFTGLFAVIDSTKSPKRMFFQGLAFGYGWFTFGLSWVHTGMAHYGGLPLFYTILFMVSLIFLLSLVPSITSLITHYAKKSFGLPFFIVFWGFAEWLRTWVLTGFPWITIGYSQTESPLASLAPIIGEIGLQSVILSISLLLHYSIKYYFKKDYKKSIANASTIIFIFVLAAVASNINWLSDDSRQLKVSLIQENITPEEKWQKFNAENIMNDVLKISEPYFKKSDIIIFSEGTIPLTEQQSEEFLININEKAYNTNTAVLLGLTSIAYTSQYGSASPIKKEFNSVISIGKKDETSKISDYFMDRTNKYNKHHLLLLGEFVPLVDYLRDLAPIFDLPKSNLNKGDLIQSNIIANGWNIATSICFELIFPDLLLNNIKTGDNPTDFIVNLSYENWFGVSNGLEQHLQVSQMRAIEFAKPVLRASNAGITAIINPDGTILDSLPITVKAVLHKEISIHKSETFYLVYGRTLNCIFLFLLLILSYHRNKFIKK